MNWYPDRLLRLALFWVLLWLTFVMLAVWRGGIDPNYVWGFVSFHGPGRSNDYWGMLVLATLGWSILYTGFRGAKAPFHAMLVAWNVILTYLFTRMAIEEGEGATLRGDAWGFEIPLQYLGPALFMFFTAAAAVWVIRDWRNGFPDRTVKPNPRAGYLLGVAAAIAILLVVLWWPGVGAYNGQLHAIAVFFTIVQTILVAMAMFPGRPASRAAQVAAAGKNTDRKPVSHPPNSIQRQPV